MTRISDSLVQTQVLWQEDFKGPAGRVPSIAYTDASEDGRAYEWQPDIGDGTGGPGPGWGNNESEYYINDAISLDGSESGALVITASKTTDANGPHGWREHDNWAYVSGKITTANRLSFHYGLIEARIKPPTDLGSWSAFWLLGDGLLSGTAWPECGEIDILESVGQEPNHLLGTIHGPGYSGDAGVTNKIEHAAALSEDFHTYSILWLPDSITWFFDDIQYHQLGPANLGDSPWVFNQPFYAILNLAMGGNLGGALDDSVETCSLSVDFVRHSAVQVVEGGPFIGELIRH